MSQLWVPVVIVVVIGLIAGLGLAIASILLAVPKDEKAEAIEEMLLAEEPYLLECMVSPDESTL